VLTKARKNKSAKMTLINLMVVESAVILYLIFG